MFEAITQRIEETELLEKVAGPVAEAVGRVTQSRSVKNALSGTWLGHPLHPLLTDIPLGAWTMASALDIFGGRKAQPAADLLVGLGVLSALPTAAAGLNDWADTYGGVQSIGVVHAVANVVGVAFHGASFMARRRGRRGRAMALSMGGLAAQTIGGWLGGHLSYARGVGVDHTALQDRTPGLGDVRAEAGVGGG